MAAFRPANNTRQAQLVRAYVVWRRFSEKPAGIARPWHYHRAIVVAALADLISPHNPVIGDLRNSRLLPAGFEGFLLETDDQGRDILSRLIHGSAVTLMVVGWLPLLPHLWACWFWNRRRFYAGRLIDAVLMRITDIFWHSRSWFWHWRRWQPLGRASKRHSRNRRYLVAALCPHCTRRNDDISQFRVHLGR